MPSSVHKVLTHGSEDALEARHKEVRKKRLNHTRKCSRVSSNIDLNKILLLTSESLISARREEIQNYIHVA